MHTLLLALTVAAAPPPQSTLPYHLAPAAPRTTGVPELDDLLREAKAAGTTVVRQFNEDGRLAWFQATPDGWLSRVRPGAEPRPAPVAVPAPVVAAPPPTAYAPPMMMAPEVAAPVRPTFRTPTRGGVVWHEGHRCPNCNYESPPNSGTWEIRGGNPNGVHQHECPRCHTRWTHSR